MPKSQDQVNFMSTDRQMDKPITLPLVHVCNINHARNNGATHQW